MPDLQEIAVGLIVMAAALYAAGRLGLLPRRRRGVTSVVRASELTRRRPGLPPPSCH